MISHKTYITFPLEKLYFIEYVLQWPRKGFGVIFLFGIAAFSFHSLTVTDNQNIDFLLLFWMTNTYLHIYSISLTIEIYFWPQFYCILFSEMKISKTEYERKKSNCKFAVILISIAFYMILHLRCADRGCCEF